MSFYAGLAVGFYAFGAVLMFTVLGYLAVLGGNLRKDGWKPFVFAPAWPLLVLKIGYEIVKDRARLSR